MCMFYNYNDKLKKKNIKKYILSQAILGIRNSKNPFAQRQRKYDNYLLLFLSQEVHSASVPKPSEQV